MIRLATLLLLLVLTTTAIASDGYTCRADGYYYDCYGQAYTRERYQYYYNRHCWYWAYRYVPHYTYSYPAKRDWKTALVGIAERRAAAEDELKKYEQDNAAFIEALKQLNPTTVEDYKILQRVAPVQSRKLVSIHKEYASGFNAEQGDTVFSVAQLSDVYNNNDLSVLYQQSARLVENAQGIAGDANAGFTDAIRAEGRERARVAEIIAKTTLVREALRAASPPYSETTDGTVVESEGGEENLATDIHTLIATKCLKCHNDVKASGGVDLGQYDKFNETQRRRVLISITTGRMPKGGRPLALAEISLFTH